MRYGLRRTNKNGSPKKRIIVALIIGLLLLAGVIAALELMDKTYIFHDKKPFVAGGTANSDTKGEPLPENTNTSKEGNGQTENDKQSSSPAPDKNAILLEPSGNFVSNHHPNLGGSPAPNEIQSVCNTTAGASCQISFIKDGVTQSLSSQIADRGGAAYWTWKLQDIGLTAGSWQVKATATLGDQTKTAVDALNLEVAP